MVTLENIQLLFDRLSVSYEVAEAKELLAFKYPAFAQDIEKMERRVADVPYTKKMSRIDAARQLYHSLDDKTRKNVINRFVSELGLPESTSSTYYYMVKE